METENALQQKQEIFSKVLDSLKTKVSDFNFKNWFQNLNFSFDEKNQVLIVVPSKFIRDWIQDHYLELIKFELFRHANTEYEIQFKIDRKTNKNLELFTTKDDPKKLEQGQKTVVKTKGKPVRVERLLGFNPDYSFETFIVGNSNQLVHAACRAVANQPAKSYNPLFIYGGVGLGKTHLINAIGLALHQQYPDWKIIYVTGEQFTNEVINAIRYDKTFDLRKKYRDTCDVLLVDDIQFIAGKERTMEEFFHTFNTLYEGRKQIILTSDKLPKDIFNLEERVRSRFGWGLLADIQSPDYETRLAILQHKAEKEGVAIPAEVLEFIAENVSTNVRDLEGALIRAVAFASLSNVPVSLDLTKEVLQGILHDQQVRLTIEGVQSQVSTYYKIKVSDLKSKRRHRNLSLPRQIAMYLCKIYIKASFPEIGQKFGGKDHTTVMHAVSKIKQCLDDDTTVRLEVKELEKILRV